MAAAPRARTTRALLVELLVALGRADLVERILADLRASYNQKFAILGATEGQTIYVNPLHNRRRADVVSTLVHEALHLARPRWSERSIERAERRVMRALRPEEQEAIYRVYRRVVRRRGGVKWL